MTEAFDCMSNSIFDNIITNGDDLDDIWQSDFAGLDVNNLPLLPELENYIEIESNSVDKSQNQAYHGYIRHDCMWSGTCVDPAHPSKKKTFKFCTNEEEITEESEMDLETEMAVEPSIFQTFHRNIKQDPAGVFQEILQNASQSRRSSIRQTTSKVNIQPFTQLQQTYNNIPIVHQNPLPSNTLQPAEVRSDEGLISVIKIEEEKLEPLTEEPAKGIQSEMPMPKVIEIEDIKLEPIDVEHIPVMNIPPTPVQPMFLCKNEPNSIMPEQFHVQPMFFCKNEAVPIPYFPQIYPMKYEPVSIMSHPFYINCPNDYDNKNHNNNYFINPTFVAHNDDGYGHKNFEISAMDRKKQKLQKKKSQNKRKSTKKCRKMKEVKSDMTQYDEIHGEGGSQRRLISNLSSDENPIEKRSMHNSMERQRRIGLKNLFVELKQAIPTLDDKERVPKVSILREAIDYCQKLRNDEKMLEELKKKHNRLMTKFHKLHKTFMTN